MPSARTFIVGLLFFSMSVANEQVRIVPLGIAVKKVEVPDSTTVVEDGFVVSVAVINQSDREITLPSKRLNPQLLERDDSVIVLFTYYPQTFTSKSGRRPLIPSRESFEPVTLRPGESMLLEPLHYPLERKDAKSKPIFFALKTKGFLADRMGFTAVDLKAAMILPDVTVSPELREP